MTQHLAAPEPRLGAEYLRPADVTQAVAMLRERPGAHLLAGGTDLLNDLRHGAIAPADVIDTADLLELRGLVWDDDAVRIGAAVTIRELLASGLGDRLVALQQAADLLGGRQIQAAATIGGNLCQASPAAEVATPLLAHGARVTVAGPGGRRSLHLADLFLGPRRTTLADDELLVDVHVAAEDASWSSAYHRIDLRRSVDIAIVSASAALDVVDGRVRAARIAVGAARPVPFLATEAAHLLKGARVGTDAEGRPGAELVAAAESAAAAAMAAARPISDVRAGEDYRKAMVGVVVRRAVLEAADGPPR